MDAGVTLQGTTFQVCTPAAAVKVFAKIRVRLGFGGFSTPKPKSAGCSDLRKMIGAD